MHWTGHYHSCYLERDTLLLRTGHPGFSLLLSVIEQFVITIWCCQMSLWHHWWSCKTPFFEIFGTAKIVANFQNSAILWFLNRYMTISVAVLNSSENGILLYHQWCQVDRLIYCMQKSENFHVLTFTGNLVYVYYHL